MKLTDSVLQHRVLMPREASTPPHPAIILLHGRGADEEDLLGLAPYLDKRFLITGVRAPYPFPYSGGFTWYEVGEVGAPDPEMFRASCDKLSSFITSFIEQYPVDKKQVYLLGFSMGTVMAYAMAFSQPSLFRGVVANSGYVAEGTHLTYRWDELSNVEFFVTHGTDDPIIPVHMARRAEQLLESGHARFEYKEYTMGHEISEQNLEDFSLWLTSRLDGTATGKH